MEDPTSPRRLRSRADDAADPLWEPAVSDLTRLDSIDSDSPAPSLRRLDSNDGGTPFSLNLRRLDSNDSGTLGLNLRRLVSDDSEGAPRLALRRRASSLDLGPPRKMQRLELNDLDTSPGALPSRPPRPHPLDASAPSVTRRMAAVRHKVLEHLEAPRNQSLLWPPRRSIDFKGVRPKKLVEACRVWRLRLRDLEALALPSWNFNCAFPSRSSFFEYVQTSEPGSPSDAETDAEEVELRTEEVRIAASETKTVPSAPLLLGTLYNIEFEGPDGLICSSARWVQLLGGVVLARLMTDARPTEVGSGVDPQWAQHVLSCLRQVAWSPDVHWIFPWRSRNRLLFLSWVGKSLGLNPAWTAGVLPFLSMDLHT